MEGENDRYSEKTFGSHSYEESADEMYEQATCSLCPCAVNFIKLCCLVDSAALQAR